MIRRFPASFAVCVALFCCAGIGVAQTTPLVLQSAVISAAARVKPSVVTIFTEKPTTNDNETPPETAKPPSVAPEFETSLGTGMIVSADGFVLTNYHVVRSSQLIRVLINADSEDVERPVARLVGFDEESDLAVLKIERTGLKPVEFADSDAVQIGQWAMAMGAPFDQPQSLTVGVVSARGRHLERPGTLGLQEFLQTDAAINPGNSGGPLLDLEGRVIGVNTAILSPSRYSVGLGFAVPANDVKRQLPFLMKSQNIRRGFLGIRYVRLSSNVAREFGVEGGMQIGAFAPGKGQTISPAQSAGLREDDIITAVDGQKVNTLALFRQLLSSKAPGSSVRLSIARPTEKEVEKFEVNVPLGEREGENSPNFAPKAPRFSSLLLGVRVENLRDVSSLDRIQWGWKKDSPTAPKDDLNGAIITEIAPGTSADEANLPLGIKIERVRREGRWFPIRGKADWLDVLTNLKPDTRLLLHLRESSGIGVYKVLIVPAVTQTNIS